MAAQARHQVLIAVVVEVPIVTSADVDAMMIADTEGGKVDTNVMTTTLTDAVSRLVVIVSLFQTTVVLDQETVDVHVLIN